MILSRLVIFLFHPLTDENTRLRQVLHVFFPFFASMEIANQQQLEAAFLPTIKTIQKAPCTSPLAEIDITTIVKFFVDLTQVNYCRSFFSIGKLKLILCHTYSIQESLLAAKPEVDHTIHDQLAMKLCTESMRVPDSNESKVYLKALLQLNMSFSNPSNTKDLHSLIQKMLRNTKEKSSVRMIEQFESIVQKHLVLNADSADSAVENSEMEVEPTMFSPVNKPRTRKLGSKHGTTLLMDAGSDADVSQNSDVFFSPESTSTQREKLREKSPEAVIEQMDSR